MPSSAAAWFSPASAVQRICTSPILNPTGRRYRNAGGKGNEFV
jgi:hypothetical protein